MDVENALNLIIARANQDQPIILSVKKKKISLAVVFYRVPFIVIMILYIHYDFIQKLLYPGSKEFFEPQIGRLERLTTPRHGNDPKYPRF